MLERVGRAFVGRRQALRVIIRHELLLQFAHHSRSPCEVDHGHLPVAPARSIAESVAGTNPPVQTVLGAALPRFARNWAAMLLSVAAHAICDASGVYVL